MGLKSLRRLNKLNKHLQHSYCSNRSDMEEKGGDKTKNRSRAIAFLTQKRCRGSGPASPWQPNSNPATAWGPRRRRRRTKATVYWLRVSAGPGRRVSRVAVRRISCREAAMSTSPAFGGGGASARRRWALRLLPPPLLRPALLFAPCPRWWKWSQLAEGRRPLRPPARLNKTNFIKNHIFAFIYSNNLGSLR